MTGPQAPISERLTKWSAHFAALAESAGASESPKTHRQFLAWREPETKRIEDLDTRTASIDDRLWSALAQSRDEGESSALDAVLSDIDPSADGPLRPQSDVSAIEVWTESELSALHALSWSAQLAERPEVLARALRGCAWHIEHTQPDNATNHAWAVHLFAVIAEREESDLSGEARLYAETLLHNCMVTSGVPDPLSARILRDASEALVRIDWGMACAR